MTKPATYDILILAKSLVAGSDPCLSQTKKVSFRRPFLFGRRTGTLNEPVLEALHNLLLNYGDIKGRLDKLNLIVNDFAHSERASAMQFLL